MKRIEIPKGDYFDTFTMLPIQITEMEKKQLKMEL